MRRKRSSHYSDAILSSRLCFVILTLPLVILTLPLVIPTLLLSSRRRRDLHSAFKMIKFYVSLLIIDVQMLPLSA